ncbi:HipA N-terminal domain-containing protein [Marinilabiliaceae bacterium ANBcel2]|nr:HipA N-terminal domain-containing protein [Marinilabiliaceae bacterium ANBcel2]
MESNVVKVRLWNPDAGYLSWDHNTHIANFEYDPDFLTQNLDIAQLTMSIYSPRSQRQIPWSGNSDKLYQGLPPMT